eukprot:g13643.t1
MLCIPCPKFLGKREGYYFGKKNYQYGTKDKNAYSDSAAQIVDEVETIVGYHKDLKKPAEGRRHPGQHRYDFLSDDEYSEQEDQESTHRHDVAESPSPDTFLFRTHCPSADLKEFSVCAAEATRRLASLPGKIKGACAGGSNKMVDGVPAQHLQPADVLPKKPANAGTVNSDGTSAAADSVLGFLDGGDSNVEQPRWATTEKMGKEWMLRARKALQSFQQPMHHYASDAHISPKGKLFFALDQYVTELAQLSVMDEVRQSLIEEVAFCIGMAMEKVLVTDRNADLEMQGAASSEAAGAGEGLHDPTTAALLRNKDSVYVAQLSHKIAYQLVRDICDPRKLRDCVLADATNALLFDRRRRDLRCAVATMKMSSASVVQESETETRNFLEKLQGVLSMKMLLKDYNMPAAVAAEGEAATTDGLAGPGASSSSTTATAGAPKLSSTGRSFRSLWQRKTALCSPTGTDSVDEKRRTEQLALASRACDALQNAYFFEAGLSHEDNTDGIAAGSQSAVNDMMQNLTNFVVDLPTFFKFPGATNDPLNVVRDLFALSRVGQEVSYHEEKASSNKKKADHQIGGDKNLHKIPMHGRLFGVQSGGGGAGGGKADGSGAKMKLTLMSIPASRGQRGQLGSWGSKDVDSRAPVTKAPAANEVSHLLDGGGTVGTPGAPAAAAAGITDMHQLRANPCFLVGQDKTDQNDLFFTLDQAERQRDNLRGGAGGGHLRSWPPLDGHGLHTSSYINNLSTSAMSTLMYSKDFDRLGELHLKFWSDVHAIHIADGLKTSATGTSHSNPRETQMDRRFIADNRIDPESCGSHSGSSHLSSPGAAPVSIRVVTSRRHIFLPKPNNPKFAVDRPFQVGPTVEQYIDPSFHFEDKVSKLNIAKDCSMLIEHHMQWQVRVEMAHIFQRFLLSRIRFLPAKMAASVAIVNQKRPQGYAVDAGELTKRKDGGGVAAALGSSGTATAVAASAPAITGTSMRNNSSRTANLAGSRGTAALDDGWRIPPRHDPSNPLRGRRGNSRNEKKKAQEAAAKEAASKSKCGLTGFEIMNNDNDPTGAMPPGWSSNYPLRPEQLRSLYWMQQREQVLDMNLELSETREEVSGALEVKFKRHLAADRAWLKTTTQTAAVPSTISSESRQASMFNQAAWSLEFEVSAQYTNRGGILADKIGFGKTATCIGLIASQKQADLEFLQRGCLREADADMELNRGGNVVLSPESSSSPSQGEVSGPATSDEEVNEDEADGANKAEAGIVEDQEDDLLADENLDMLAKGPARKRRKIEPAVGSAGATTATSMKTAPGGPKSMKAAAASKKAAQSKTAAMKTAASKNKGPTAGGGKKNEDEEGEDGAGRTSASGSDHHSAGGAPAGTKLSFAMQCELLQMVEADKGGFFPAPKTTLILVPSHLIDQWSTEIEKFLPNNKLKILICKNISPLKIRSVYEIQQYDIILVTYRVLYSSIHQQRFEELSGLDVDKKKHEEDTRRNQAEMQKKGFASMYSGMKHCYNTFLGAGTSLSSGALGRKPAEQSKAAVDQAFEQSTDRQNYITKLRENTRKYIEKGGNVRGSGSGKNDKFKAWSAKANVKEEVLFDPLAAGAATQQEAAPTADVDDAMEIDEVHANVEDKKPKLPAMKTASRSQAAASQASKGGARATGGTQSTTKVFDKIEKSEQYRLLQFPLLEQFYFRRIVFDEFHELEAFGDKQVSTLLNLKAFSKFGLTGTPQVDSVRNVAATASLFGIDLVGVSQIEAEYADRLWRFVTRTEFSARHVMDELAKSQPTYNFTKREGTLGSAIAYPARPQTQYFLKPMPDWICNCCLEPAWGTGADPSSATVASAAQDPRMSPTTKVEFTCKHCGTKNHTSDLFFRGNQKPTTRRAAAGGANVNNRAGGAGAVHHGAATSNAVLMAQNPALAARAVSARAGASTLACTGAGTAASAADAAGSSSAVAAGQQERLLPADDELLPVANTSASLVSAAPAAPLSEADVFGDASPMEIDDSPAESGDSEHLLSRLLDSEEMSDGGASSISDDFAYGGRGTAARAGLRGRMGYQGGRRMQHIYSDSFSSDDSCTDSEDLSSESDSLRNELRRERWEIDSRGRGGGARRNAVCYGHGGPGSNHAILVAQALAEAPEKFHFHASARKFASQRMNYVRRCHPWDRSKIFRDNCERFLKRFVRQNSAVTDADKIVTKEHWIAVTHTAEERAIYLAQQNALNYTAAEQGGEGDGAAAERRRRADADGALDDLEKRARLLQLCSHFTLGEHSKADTGSECSRIFDRKQNAVKQALKQFKAAARQLAVVRAIYREDPEKRRQAFETVNQKMQTVCAGADLDSSSAVLGEEDESFNLALGNVPPGPATGMVLGLDGRVMKKASAKGAANKTKRNTASSKKAADTDRRSSAVGPASESAGANAKKESGEGVNKQASSAAEKHSREATFYSEFPLQAAVVQKLMEQTEEKLSTSSAKKIFSSAETGRPLVDWEQIVSNFFVSEKEEKDGAKSGGADGAAGAASSSSRANNVEQQSKNGKSGSSTKPPPFKRFVPAGEGPPKKTATKEQKTAYDKQKWLESRLDNLRERMVNTFNREFENLREATNVFAFFKKTLQIYGGAGGAAESGGDSGRSCVLCMEDELPVSNLSITSCGHVFCVECIHRQMRAEHMLCGLCRKPLQQKDIYSLALEMRSAGVKIEAKAEQAKIDNLRNAEIGIHGSGGPVCMPVAGGVVVDPNAIKYDNDVISAEIRDPEKYAEFGSKIQSICQVLLHIEQTEPGAKVILFCQWKNLMQKIGVCLTKYGFAYATLTGGAIAQNKKLSEFKNMDNQGGANILLLSLETSAAGTNLAECCHHCLLVHPMNATTVDRAIAFELQAIGRIRRYGQQAAAIHVWRFLTLNSVEEEIVREHAKAIRERQETKKELLPAESGEGVL